MRITSFQESVISCFCHSLSYSLVLSLDEFDLRVLFHATASSLFSLESSTLLFPFSAFRACFLSLLPVLRASAPPWVCPRVSTCERICSSTSVFPSTCWSVVCVLNKLCSLNYISVSICPVTPPHTHGYFQLIPSFRHSARHPSYICVVN